MLVVALGGTFALGCVARCSILGISMAFETGDKSGYKQQIKHALIAFVISILVTGTGALPSLINRYFS